MRQIPFEMVNVYIVYCSLLIIVYPYQLETYNPKASFFTSRKHSIFKVQLNHVKLIEVLQNRIESYGWCGASVCCCEAARPHHFHENTIFSWKYYQVV